MYGTTRFIFMCPVVSVGVVLLSTAVIVSWREASFTVGESVERVLVCAEIEAGELGMSASLIVNTEQTDSALESGI